MTTSKPACRWPRKNSASFAARMTGIWLFSSVIRFQSSVLGRIAAQQGRSRSERGDGFMESRASRLVKGFENAAPAWPVKQRPATNLHLTRSLPLISPLCGCLRQSPGQLPSPPGCVYPSNLIRACPLTHPSGQPPVAR
jgi:hypothetical protein